jgi:hypothetical protein
MTEQNNTKVIMNHNGTRSYQFQPQEKLSVVNIMYVESNKLRGLSLEDIVSGFALETPQEISFNYDFDSSNYLSYTLCQGFNPNTS